MRNSLRHPFSNFSPKIIIFLVVLLCGEIQGVAQSKHKSLDTLFNAAYKNNQFIGAVLVADGEKVIYKKAFGKANYEWNAPNTVDTKFKLASLGKQFTALIVLQLAQEGLIDLNDKVSKYLPEYPLGDSLTIHHLLSHTSGLPHYPDNFEEEFGRKEYTPWQYFEVFKNCQLQFKPGTDFYYSSFNYVLLGLVVERAVKKDFNQYLIEKIFVPLKLNNTGIAVDSVVTPNLASGYILDASGKISRSTFRSMSTTYGTGQAYSTVDDLYKWHGLLLTDKLLKDDYRKLLFKPNLNYHAYGWNIIPMSLRGTEQRVSTALHTGGYPGFSTIMVRDLEKKNVIIILSNSQNTNVEVLSKEVMNILYGKQFKTLEVKNTNVN